MIECTEGRTDGAATVDEVQGTAVAVGEGPIVLDAEDELILTHENGHTVTLLPATRSITQGTRIDRVGPNHSETITLLRPWTRSRAMLDPRPKVYFPKF